MPRSSPTEHKTESRYTVRYRGEWMGSYSRGQFARAEEHFRRLGGEAQGATVDCTVIIPTGNARDGLAREETRRVRGAGA